MPTAVGLLLGCAVVLAAGPARAASFGFAYDADGIRIKSSDPTGPTVYPFGDDYEVHNGVVTKYLTAGLDLLAKRVGTQTSWVGTDSESSVRVLDDATRAAVGRASYAPFGDRISQTGQAESRGFTGQRHDGTHLVYLHARYYDPALGRFISPDLRVPQSGAGSLNRYTYAFDDPVNHTDTQGLDEDPPLGEVVPGRHNNWLRKPSGWWSAVFPFGDNTMVFYKPMPNQAGWVAAPADLILSDPLDRYHVRNYFPDRNKVSVVESGDVGIGPAEPVAPSPPAPEPPSPPGIERAPVAPVPVPAAPEPAPAAPAAKRGVVSSVRAGINSPAGAVAVVGLVKDAASLWVPEEAVDHATRNNFGYVKPVLGVPKAEPWAVDKDKYPWETDSHGGWTVYRRFGNLGVGMWNSLDVSSLANVPIGVANLGITAGQGYVDGATSLWNWAWGK
jgi:RHS repeat-associated protein